jgi:hypothetical protein
MASRPAFQHQGPDSNCVIDGVKLGWVSCTSYAMAMLIDASTDGEERPKGCRVRRLVAPQNVIGGLTLGQVAEVAEDRYGVPIQRRTGGRVIPIERLARRVSRGWGFLLQGNNTGFVGKGSANHAIYVHQVRGGTPAEPKEALVYDSQRFHEVWIPWHRVVSFGEALRPDEAVPITIAPGRLWAGFGPRPMGGDDPDEEEQEEGEGMDDEVQLAFGATRLDRPDRLRADPPPGRRINVRDNPRRLGADHVVRTLRAGDPFLAFQKVTDGAVPPGAMRGVWFGNRRGTLWVHRSGVRGVGRPS